MSAWRYRSALLLGAIYRLGRLALAVKGIALATGHWWPALLLAVTVPLGLKGIECVAAAFALWRAVNVPLPLALLLVAPRLLTRMPGWILTLKARWRHPRPRWSVVTP